MSKAITKGQEPGDPVVIRFTARLEPCHEVAKAHAWATLNIPPEASHQLNSMTNIEGTINGHPFRTALEANSSGGYRLRVNQAMRNGAGAAVGDTVQLAVLGPEPEPEVPAEMLAAFAAAPTMQALWEDLTLLGRLDWIRWIEGAKQPTTRARRIIRTIEQLAEGKRRPCCVNFYEYMLCRIQKS